MEEWKVAETDVFRKSLKKYVRRHEDAGLQAMHNAARYLELLNAKIPPEQIKLGFVHNEKMHGTIAVDSRKGKRRMKATRLYLFPDRETKTLWYLFIGGKDTQKADLRDRVKPIVNQIIKSRRGEKHGGCD